MSEVTKKDLDSWVSELMTTKKIDKYEISVSGCSEKGDGYLGEITFLTVSTKRNNVKKDYNLVIKSAKQGEDLRKTTPIKEAYDRESFLYAKVFPIYKEFQLAQNIEKCFDAFPKCYSVHTEERKEAIILQNLKKVGYELHNRKAAMNLDHVHLVFAQYGKLHAISMAMQHKQPGLFKSITKNFTDVMGNFVLQAKMVPTFVASFEHVKKLLEADNEREVLAKLSGFETQFESCLVGMSDENTKPAVITHGDCWNNNFMFKYDGKDKSKPREMTFLDFQLSRVASPIIDLSYFLYCCADGRVLKSFDFILQAYHSSLSDALSEYECDIDEIFPYQTLKEQWKTFGKFGLVMSLFIIKIAMCEEAPDLLAEFANGKDLKEVQVEVKNGQDYDTRIKDVFIHFAEQFL